MIVWQDSLMTIYEDISEYTLHTLEESQLKFEIAQLKQLTHIMESIPTFAQDADEGQWTALDGTKAVYTEQEVTDMQTQAISMFYKDPGARGLIETLVNFIIGKDVSIEPEDPSPDVKAYWESFVEVNEWDMRSKEFVRRTLRDGENFLRFFKPAIKSILEAADVLDTQNINNTISLVPPKVRFIHPPEIKDESQTHSYGIETDENDVEIPITYYRSYAKRDGTPANEKIPADEIIHTKILVDSDVKRGVSFLVGNAKYLTKYSAWLEDRIMLNRIRTVFNLIMKVSGDPTAIKSKFEDTTTSGTLERKKMPARGSVLVGTQGIEYEFANLNIHAEDTKDDGRNIELMLCKGTGLTEYIVRGDASNANYSSSMVSESPMVRAILAWEDFFTRPFKKVFAKVIAIGIEKGYITSKNLNVLKCKINFTRVIHRDLKKDSDAAKVHRELEIVSKRTLAENFGYNYDEEKKRMETENLADSVKVPDKITDKGVENEDDKT